MLPNKVNRSSLGQLNGDRFLRLVTKFIVSLVALLLCAIFVFILIKAIPGIKAYGIKNIFFTGKFDLFNKKNPKAGIWLPILITLLVCLITTTLASLFGVRTALFLKFRIHPKFVKHIKLIVDLLASVPSVIYGVFCINTLSPLFGKIFGLNHDGSLISASITLSLMVLPVIVAFVYNAADALSYDFFLSSIALGNTKTHAIHKVVKKKIRPVIIVAIIFGSTRILCESSALNMILSKVNYNEQFQHGFLSVLLSGLKPLGVIIPAFYFTDTASPAAHSILFAFGIVMFILTTMVNAVVFYVVKLVNTQAWFRLSMATAKLLDAVKFIPRQSIRLVKFIFNPRSLKDQENASADGDDAALMMQQIHGEKVRRFYSLHKLFSDYCFALTTLLFALWILLDIIVKGLLAICSADALVFSNQSDSTGRALINTFIVILIAMMIVLPVSLFTAIGISEFTKEGRLKKTLIFFLDSFSATPSIIFGLFGVILFINLLGWTDTDTVGTSLIAGIFTISVVVLPSYSRGIQSGLENVDQQVKLNSFALGANKWITTWRITLPIALNTILNASILTVSRIISETTPIYLTAGLNSSRSINLLRSGQTLTTRIYAQLFQTDLKSIDHAEYSSALLSIVLLLLLIVTWQLFLPYIIAKKVIINAWIKHKYRSLKFARYHA